MGSVLTDPVAASPAFEADRRTTTADSLLGLLSMGAMTGYELRQTIESSIGNFWSESFGQIYPALKRLEAEGLVDSEQQVAVGRPPRRVYRLTDAGRDRLIGWLTTPARLQVPRNELLLKLFFGGEIGPTRSRDHLLRFLEEQKQLRLRYTAIETMLHSEHRDAPAMPYWRLTVRYGLRQAEALQQWAEDALKELNHMAPDPGKTEEPRRQHAG